MTSRFLGLDAKSKGEKGFCFIGIEFCSAKYLFGVQKAADRIRELSFRYANADGSSLPLKVYSPEAGYILKDTKAYDLGNISADNFKELDKKLLRLDINTNCIPIFVGGDHSVTYSLVKKMTTNYKDVVVVQFDAHSDFIDEFYDYPHGSVMNETSKLEGVLKIIHFGIRGNLNSYPAISDSKEKGNIVIPYNEIGEKIDNLIDYLKDKNVYITFDTDFLNPAIAPATNCPEPGGPSYEEACSYLKAIINSSKRIIGVDFVEYNPTCAGASLTGITIVNLIMEMMSYMTK